MLAGALKKRTKYQKRTITPENRHSPNCGKTTDSALRPSEQTASALFLPFFGGVHPHSQPAAKKSGQTQKKRTDTPKSPHCSKFGGNAGCAFPPFEKQTARCCACFLGAPPLADPAQKEAGKREGFQFLSSPSHREGPKLSDFKNVRRCSKVKVKIEWPFTIAQNCVGGA